MAVPTFRSYASPPPHLAFSSSFFNLPKLLNVPTHLSHPLDLLVLQIFYPKFPFPLQQLTLYLAKSFCEPPILNPMGRPRERRITGATEGPAQGGGARAQPKTNLSLSNPQRRQERLDTRLLLARWTKILPSLSFPSSKQWTGIWFSAHQDLRLHFDSIGRESIDIIIVLGSNLCTIIAKSFIHGQRERLTKVPPVICKFWASGNGPKPEC